MSENLFGAQQISLLRSDGEWSAYWLYVIIDYSTGGLAIPVYGYRSEHADLITLEGLQEVPLAHYESRLEHACTTLRNELEMELNEPF